MEQKRFQNVNDESYTNRELWLLLDTTNKTNDLQHAAIIESMRSFHITTLNQLNGILEQTKKTNSNVTDLMMWRQYIKGQTFIIPLVIAALISGLISLLFKYL